MRSLSSNRPRSVTSQQTGATLRFMNGGDTGLAQCGDDIVINPFEISYSY